MDTLFILIGLLVLILVVSFILIALGYIYWDITYIDDEKTKHKRKLKWNSHPDNLGDK